jgi:hypothetical protein
LERKLRSPPSPSAFGQRCRETVVAAAADGVIAALERTKRPGRS